MIRQKSFDYDLVNTWEYLVLLDNKLSSKEIHIKKTVIVRKKVNCKLCQEYYKEYDSSWKIEKKKIEKKIYKKKT